MRLDTHVHTSPGSRCSVMGIAAYLEAIAKQGLTAACVTNHGDMADYRLLADVAPAGLVLIPGVEISSETGDFLIYSTDFDFLSSLSAIQKLPPRSQRPAQCVVIWAHPFAGVSERDVFEEFTDGVAAQVDAVEVYNGNWPDEEASVRARRIAARFGLAETGGSDAHRREDLLRCYTELEGIGSAADLIEAISCRMTRAISL